MKSNSISDPPPGSFQAIAERAERLKETFRSSPNWHTFTPAERHGLEMIAHKLGCILGGDAQSTEARSHWKAVASYSQLVTGLD